MLDEQTKALSWLALIMMSANDYLLTKSRISAERFKNYYLIKIQPCKNRVFAIIASCNSRYKTMALIKEDGTGLPDSNAYTDIIAFKDWASNRDIDVSGFLDAQIEGALVVATEWLDARYTFKGQALSDTQALSLPTDTVSINRAILSATCHIAHYHLSGLLTPSATTVGIKSQRKKLDTLETETVYQDGVTQKQSYALIDSLLKKYTVSGGGVGVVFNGV